MTLVHQREEGVSLYAWKHRLYALGVEELPFTWQGQYSGHTKGCTVILEAVASQDLWILHSFFGMAGAHNGINVLRRSLVFARLPKGNAPLVIYEIMAHTYTKGYYLADGIYLEWPVFVKTYHDPKEEKYSSQKNKTLAGRM
jgi:hypothetical protein